MINTLEVKNLSDFIDQKNKINNFKCGNKLIETFLYHDAYYQQIMCIKKTSVIILNEMLLGFYSLENKIINIYDDDYSNQDGLQCICLSYIAIDINYQNKGIGSKILYAIIQQIKTEISPVIPCSGIIIDAIIDRQQWYENLGFEVVKIKKNNHDLTVPMFLDFRNKEIIDSFFEE
jgi:hypothetical protein